MIANELPPFTPTWGQLKRNGRLQGDALVVVADRDPQSAIWLLEDYYGGTSPDGQKPNVWGLLLDKVEWRGESGIDELGVTAAALASHLIRAGEEPRQPVVGNQ
jgi:hypothetical protein